MEKSAQAGGGGRGTLTPFTLSTITDKVAMFAPVERADTGGLQRDVDYLGWPIRGGMRGLGQRVHLYTGAQINFGDLTPYLTYGRYIPPILLYPSTYSVVKSFWRRRGCTLCSVDSVHQKRFIYRLLARHGCLPVWLVAAWYSSGSGHGPTWN